MGLLQAVGQGIGGILGLNPQQTQPTPAPDYSAPDGVGMSQSQPTAPVAPSAPSAGGILGEVGQDASNFGRGLLALPGNALQAYVAQFAATPANIQLELAQRAAQVRQAQAIWQATQGLPPAERIAAMTNGPEYGKAVASRFEAANVPAGDSRIIPPAAGDAGGSFFAPKVGVDEKSGTAYSQTPQGVMPLGQFGGDYTVGNGLITSGRTGAVAGTYSTPQALAPGSSPGSFTPSVSGASPGFSAPGPSPLQPQAPATAPSGDAGKFLPAIQRDPKGFFSTLIGGPVTITSGYRTPAHNASVGGSATSEHMTNSAWDIVPPSGVSNAQVINQIKASGVPFDQLLDEGTHVHFGIGPKMRGQVASVGAGAPRAIASSTSAPGWSVGAATGSPTIIPPGDPRYAGFAPGTVLQNVPGKGVEVVQTPTQGGNYSDQDKARMAALASEAEAANQYAQQAQQFTQLAGARGSKGTGPFYHVPGSDTVGAFFDPNLRTLENLGTQMATTLRSPGMRMTQMEFKKFGEVSPSIENTPESNISIRDQARQLAAWKQQKATFYQDWLAKTGNLNGADAAWDQHEAQVLGGNTQAANPASGAPSAPPVGYTNARGFQYLGVAPANPSDPRNWRKVK